MTHLIGERSAEVMLLVHIYMVNIPAVIFLNLMRGLLEGTRRFGWSGAARSIFFTVQAVGFGGLWLAGHLTVASASVVMIASQLSSMVLAFVAVRQQLQPKWQPSWVEFKNSLHYGMRDYAGGMAEYTTLRVDQLMLGAMASNSAMGLYVMAVRLSEVTTYAASAVADALMPEMARFAQRRRGRSAARAQPAADYLCQRHRSDSLMAGCAKNAAGSFRREFRAGCWRFRWLLVAAVVWSASTIVIRGFQGFGHPGLTTIARICVGNSVRRAPFWYSCRGWESPERRSLR